MSRVIVRLMLSAALVFAAPFGVFISLMILFEVLEFRSYGMATGDVIAIVVASIVNIGLFAVLWLAIWFGQIRWTSSRIVGLLVVAGASFVPAAAVVIVFKLVLRGSESLFIGMVFGSFTWMVALMAGSAIVWRENAADRAARLREMGASILTCTDCGYNLTGVTSGQCPECGCGFEVTRQHELTPGDQATNAGLAGQQT